ncbi:hypothetical protein HZS38_02130 [Xenorhabdus nematophila]|uniref:Protealysin N-terminal propeptide domain-containing protein n=1 Tax=Xenorhabdus nematophila (strain ATCC 19061 / DSM 3370 / CCUG 14189 / LMG 1036 / NCIMB 9965 / AN6) TaxID=406817 RepID=D3VLP9_XENNA|nr:protealysin propeptide domain-containing protein [Xenorhabdus nematophila]CEE90481.1 hypothetical protein XNA1_1540034 [Xenorhabdus nematophila str. Anatoliense]CEF32858.1 hypothetical protein XNW1_4530070 [Xenorhabdus nematophila str. Websteri]AYA39482.1 hypothetical protein D3790_02465 [Xenorhabdus nematophila]MBA0018049.1 hypothetical protein [Xenorhabdus nematophila]MCB4424553.1 hypothetical protein [Xenorhabdus nematophila]
MCNNKVSKQSIIPPYLLEYIAKTCDDNDKECVLNTLEHVNNMMKKSVEEDSLKHKDNSIIYNKKTLSEEKNN